MTIRRLPISVTLPNDLTIDYQTTHLLLGNVSKPVVSYWKRAKAFPIAHASGAHDRRYFYVTNEIERWLQQQNVVVRRI